MTELKAMQKHRLNLIQTLRDLESGRLRLTQGMTHHLDDVTVFEIAALKVEIADLHYSIIEAGGTLPD